MGDVVVLDLSRVLAGPWASQLLGDLGAEVIKVEQPGAGDDTRRWGPPFVQANQGQDAAYFMCANRNKLGIAIDFARPEGAELVRALARQADVVIENFKVGGLAKFGLDYATLARTNDRLIYCSVTGFGQTGPYASRGGYDFLVQGMSGLMSVTGTAEGGPTKVGIPVSDLFTGLYAASAILAALHHRDRTGEGQYIDCALLDSQLAVLAHQAANYLVGDMVPSRVGNAHSNVVPYRDFATRDGHVLVAAGTDRQFRAFCRLLGLNAVADDPAYATNAGRLRDRASLERLLEDATTGWATSSLLKAMEKEGVPGGGVNTVPQAFADPQVTARGVVQTLVRSDGTHVKVPGYPAVLSRTPASYRLAPPLLGENTEEVLARRLSLTEQDIQELRAMGVIE